MCSSCHSTMDGTLIVTSCDCEGCACDSGGICTKCAHSPLLPTLGVADASSDDPPESESS